VRTVRGIQPAGKYRSGVAGTRKERAALA